MGTPYVGYRQDSIIVFDSLAPGDYSTLIPNTSNLSIVDTLEVGPGDSILINGSGDVIYHHIITTILDSWRLEIPHSNPIYSVSYVNEQWWIGTENTGIWYTTTPTVFLQNSSAQTTLNREPILDLQTWGSGLNTNMVLRGDQYCYYYINSAFEEIGASSLPQYYNVKCEHSHLDSLGQVHFSFGDVLESRSTSGIWSTFKSQGIQGIFSSFDSTWIWNQKKEIISVQDSSVTSLSDLPQNEVINSIVKYENKFYIASSNGLWVFSRGQLNLVAQLSNPRELSLIPSTGLISGLNSSNGFFVFTNDVLLEYQGIIANPAKAILDMTQVNQDFYFTNGTSSLIWISIP